MNAFDQLESQLLEAVQTRRRRRATVLGLVRPQSIGFAASALLAVAVAAFAIVALAHRGSQPGPATPPAGLHVSSGGAGANHDLDMAITSTLRRDRACQPLPSTPHDQVITDATPGAALMSELGLLRRAVPLAASVPDRLLHDQMIERGTRGAYVRYIRLMARVDGVRYYLIPVARIGFTPIPARCYGEFSAALRQQVSGLDRSARAHVLAGGRRAIRAMRRNFDAPASEGVVIATIDRHGKIGGGVGDTAARLRHGGLTYRHGNTVIGLVTDGVARGSVKLGGHMVGAAVVDNVWVARAPRR